MELVIKAFHLVSQALEGDECWIVIDEIHINICNKKYAYFKASLDGLDWPVINKLLHLLIAHAIECPKKPGSDIAACFGYVKMVIEYVNKEMDRKVEIPLAVQKIEIPKLEFHEQDNIIEKDYINFIECYNTYKKSDTSQVKCHQLFSFAISFESNCITEIIDKIKNNRPSGKINKDILKNVRKICTQNLYDMVSGGYENDYYPIRQKVRSIELMRKYYNGENRRGGGNCGNCDNCDKCLFKNNDMVNKMESIFDDQLEGLRKILHNIQI